MSVRRQPLLRLPRSFARQAALLLGFAAAFLPALIPGLHAGHGLPTLAPVALAEYQAHGAGHHHVMNQHSEPNGTPAPAPKRPESGTCPICRTLQQLAAWTIPDGAVLLAPVVIVVDRDAPPVAAPILRSAYTPSQPRAPPVAV